MCKTQGALPQAKGWLAKNRQVFGFGIAAKRILNIFLAQYLYFSG
jgi:hypothetical protein